MAPRSFVGVLEGAPRSARIAIIVQGGTFLAYACSQDAEFNAACSRWFQGEIGTGGTIRASAGGLDLRGTLGDDQVSGEVGPERKPLRFTARRVPAGGDAGLYRSETRADGTNFVAGWIIDLDDNVAGAVSCHGQRTVIVTPPPARPGVILNARTPDVPAVVANKLGQPGSVRKLNTPATTPPPASVTRGVKIDDTVRAEVFPDALARLRARGGSPLLAIFLHQARRVLAGASPTGLLEERLFERLNEFPPGALKQVVAAFDQLPEADRTALLGPGDKLPTPDQPLDQAGLDALSTALTARGTRRPPRQPGEKGVSSLTVGRLVCVRETPPAGVGSDDVIVVLVATSGRTLNLRVSEPLRGLDTETSRNIPPADGQAWPPPEGKASTEEVVLAAALIEDDSGDPTATAALLRGFATVTSEALGAIAGGLLDIDTTEPLLDGFAAVSALQAKALFLGSDRVGVQGNRILGADGKARDRLTIKQSRPDGALKIRYDLMNLRATP
jgi:hypothetical protein